MKLSTRISRTYAVGSLAARVYLGYKWISVREKRFGLRHKKANRKRLRHHTWSANHFYDVAVRRQGLLIKLGQVIGSRPDLIPDEYIDVLSRLQDAVPPHPFNTIRRVVERELGRPLADLFDGFEETPIASASLAQVHRARLKPTASEPEGRVVAVKVQYPRSSTTTCRTRASSCASSPGSSATWTSRRSSRSCRTTPRRSSTSSTRATTPNSSPGTSGRIPPVPAPAARMSSCPRSSGSTRRSAS